MKIAIDAQLLLDAEKTGIAWFAEHAIWELQKRKYGIEFNFFCRKKEACRIARFQKEHGKTMGEDDTVNLCTAMGIAAFRALSAFLPVPYAKMMGSKADASLFFNYIIPYGVSGKKISMVHDMAYKACPQTVKWKTRVWLALALPVTCKRADCILTPSQFSKREIMKYQHVPEGKIKVISCGVDRGIYHAYEKEKIEEVKRKNKIAGEYYLYVGTLEPRKNVERLLLAYKMALEKRRHLPILVLAGKKGWMYGGIFRLLQKLRLNGKVRVTGYLPKEEVSVLMSGAKIFLYPSLYEGFGMPPLEAMACKTPVIVSNVASLPEVAGDAGILVNPYSAQDISKAILHLETNEARRIALAQKGYERSRQFTWDRVGEKISAALQEAVGGDG